jgi:hypothetical protein
MALKVQGRGDTSHHAMHAWVPTGPPIIGQFDGRVRYSSSLNQYTEDTSTT